MQIRVACKLIEEEDEMQNSDGLFEFVESCLRHKSEMVIYEAASAIVNLKRTRYELFFIELVKLATSQLSHSNF